MLETYKVLRSLHFHLTFYHSEVDSLKVCNFFNDGMAPCLPVRTRAVHLIFDRTTFFKNARLEKKHIIMKGHPGGCGIYNGFAGR